MRCFFLYFLLFIINSGCKDSLQEPGTDSLATYSRDASKNGIPATREQIIKPEILPDSVVLFGAGISDTLLFDFNCDELPDAAFFRKSEGATKLVIRDAKTANENIIGTDTSFEAAGDNFNWVDTWGATADTATYEFLTKNGRIYGKQKVKLNCFSIVFRKHPTGGGIITFINGTYRWIYQGD